MKYRCPTCKKNFDNTADRQEFFPFCSSRCKLVDLGSWLNSEYKIAESPVNSVNQDVPLRQTGKNNTPSEDSEANH
jgi:hypothetical protein